MRIVLTLLAVLVVAALSAALVGPIFVDWGAERGRIEALLSERLGARVEIAGPIEVRFLPTAYISMRKVAVEAGGDGEPPFACDALRLEFALSSLVAGQIRVSDAHMERPVVRWARGAAAIGGLRARFARLADRVALDRLTVDHGALIVGRGEGAAPRELSDIHLEVAAPSLIGPFRGFGDAALPDGERIQYQFVSAEAVDNILPLKAEVYGGPGSPHATFDGKLSFSAEPSLTGSAALSGSAPVFAPGVQDPWRISGEVRADTRRASAEALTVRLGPDERALEATGSARWTFGANPGLDVDLKSKQLNLDALLRRPGEDAAPPARLLDALRRAFALAAERRGPSIPVQFGFSADSAILGAQTLDELSLTVASKPGQPLDASLGVGLPGTSRVDLSGAIEFGVAADFRGKGSARIGDFAELRDWATRDAPELEKRLAALSNAFPYASVSAAGDLEASSVGFAARGLKLVVDRSALTGAVAYSAPVAAEHGRVFVDLRSDALDIDSAPNLSASADGLGDLDLSLALDATKLRIARVGETTLDSGSLSLKATKTGDSFSLDRLSIGDLGGANIEAEGAATPTGNWAKATVDAAHLRDFAALVARVAPGPYARAFVDRAEALSPAKATFEARRDGASSSGDFPLDFLKADGEAGQSRFSLKLTRAADPAAGLAADLTLDASDAAALLRQLGAQAPSTPAGRAHVSVSATGLWQRGFDAQAAASVAGTDLAWRGRLIPNVAMEGDSPLFGSVTVKGDNLAPLLALFGLVSPNAPLVMPANLAADMVLRNGDVSAPRISGTISGARTEGNLVWRGSAAQKDAASLGADILLARSIVGDPPTPAVAQLSGELAFDRASSGALLALALGPAAPAKSGALWSDAKFAPPILKPPSSDIKIRIGAIDLADGSQARSFGARLQMDAAKFELDDVSANLAGGKASGQATLRRDGPVAALSGRIAVDGLALDRSVLRGRFGATLDFASTGQSPTALIAGLVGEAGLRLDGVTLARLDPGALGRVVAKAQGPDAMIDATNVAHAFSVELDRQPLALPDGPAAGAMSGGVVRVGPLALDGRAGSVKVSGDFDLRNLSVDLHAGFTTAPVGKFWNGPPPAATASFSGPLDAPVRDVEIASFSAGLAAQALARETDRIATLEADLRERAWFNRRLKAEQFLMRRGREMATYEGELKRSALEADKMRIEDALIKAQVDRAQPPEPPPAPAILGDAPAPDAPAPSPLIVSPKSRMDAPDPAANGIY